MNIGEELDEGMATPTSSSEQSESLSEQQEATRAERAAVARTAEVMAWARAKKEVEEAKQATLVIRMKTETAIEEAKQATMRLGKPKGPLGKPSLFVNICRSSTGTMINIPVYCLV